MTIPSRTRLLLGLGLTVASTLALATPPAAFTANYKVLRDGSAMGQATVTLRPGKDGQWLYTRDIEGTSGMAAMLGASVKESSHFRWKGDVPEAVSYEYAFKAAFKNKQRHLAVDWSAHQVNVDSSKGKESYPSQPGMVERNTTALAVGLALRNGQQQIDLPVAVRQKVEKQTFKVTGKQKVKVPAGSFDTVEVQRTDADRGFTAWYATNKYPVPVKITQKEGGNLTMELVDYTAQ